jgi:hypothetical protein
VCVGGVLGKRAARLSEAEAEEDARSVLWVRHVIYWMGAGLGEGGHWLCVTGGEAEIVCQGKGVGVEHGFMVCGVH